MAIIRPNLLSSPRLFQHQPLLHTRTATTTMRPLIQSGLPKHRVTQRRQAWTGSDPSEHVTNSADNLDIQTNASKAGRSDRAQGAGGGSEGGERGGLAQSRTEQDARSSNERAKQDHPEAPGPVIGMNDERGSVRLHSFFILDSYYHHYRYWFTPVYLFPFLLLPRIRLGKGVIWCWGRGYVS